MMDTEALFEQIDELVILIKELPERPTKAQLKVVQGVYSSLHRKYAAVDLPPEKLLTGHYGEVVRFLELGKASFSEFHKAFLPLIRESGANTAENIAKFLKSPAAFRHIHREEKKLSKEATEDLVAVQEVLGGMLGVEVGESFVLAVRGEMAGRVLAYALSDLCEQDLAEYKGDPSNAGERDAYLLNCIQKHSALMVYSNAAPEHRSSDHPIAVLINEVVDVDPSVVRSRNRGDHCMVNHKKKKIVFGGTTSGKEADNDQSLSAIKMFSALQLLTKQEYVGTPPRLNPYYGYEVEPFFFHSGYLPEESQNKGNEYGRAFFEMLMGGNKDRQIDSFTRSAIAKMAFFSIFSEATANAAVARVWKLFNIHICGCDTLSLYNEMQAARAPGASPRAFSEIVLKGLLEASEVLGREDFSISLTDRGQNILEPVLAGLINAVENHSVNFPLGGDEGKDVAPQVISAVEKAFLAGIASNFTSIATKIKNENSGFGVTVQRTLLRLAREINEGSMQEHWTKISPEYTGLQYIWSNAQYDKVFEREGGFLEDPECVAHIARGIAEKIAKKKVPAVFEEAFKMAQSEASSLSRRPFVEGLAKETFEAIKNATSPSFVASKNKKAFDVAFCNVRKGSAEDHSASNFVMSLRPLYRKGVWESCRSGEVGSTTKSGKALEEVVEELMRMAAKDEGANVLKELKSLHSLGLSCRRRAPK